MDVWGRIYQDQWSGKAVPHYVERDDGLVHCIDSAADYFEAPRSAEEREFLDRLIGPVLDLGCGPGSYALYLQGRGIPVTAVDSSAGAIAVCRARGCADARVGDIRALDLSDDAYGGVIVMGNTLGVHQDPSTLPQLLAVLRRATQSRGRLVAATIDPLETDDPRHLAYHRRNRERGLPPGLTRIRMKYRDMVDDWVQLWLLTDAELDAAVAQAGWTVADRRRMGPQRINCYEAIG